MRKILNIGQIKVQSYLKSYNNCYNVVKIMFYILTIQVQYKVLKIFINIVFVLNLSINTDKIKEKVF